MLPNQGYRNSGDLQGLGTLAALPRLLRNLGVPYYEPPEKGSLHDGIEELVNSQFTGKSNPTEYIHISIRKSGAEGSHAPQTTFSPYDIDQSQVYMEVCIMNHPALKGHANLLELLGVTLIAPFGDATPYQFGLITHVVHGTLEEFLAVETKSSRDPRPYLISWAEKEDIAIQCAEGLAALHDCHILHNNVQLSSIVVFVTQHSEETRTIKIKISCFGSAVSITPSVALDDIPYGNGLWSSIGPLATCTTSAYCRDIHAYGLMIMHLSFYEFMDIEGSMNFLKVQRGFYDELGMHPGLDTTLGLHHVVSRCCISHDTQPVSLHWVAPVIQRDYQSIAIEEVHEWFPKVLTEIPFSSITQLAEEFTYLRMQARTQPSLNALIFANAFKRAQRTSVAVDTLYLSFCYSYGVGTMRSQRLAFQSCVLAASSGSVPAKSIVRMLHDAYIQRVPIQDNGQYHRLQSMGVKLDAYLIEALELLQETDAIDNEMARMCWYIRRTNPEMYAAIFPGLKWPHIVELLKVFQEENVFLGSWSHPQYRQYQKTLQFAVEMQSQFPLQDGSSILHCLAQIVYPKEVDITTLATIVVASGSDITSRRKDGKPALELAVGLGNNALVTILLETLAALGMLPDLMPLLSQAALLHHHDVMITIARFVTGDHDMALISSRLLVDAFRRPMFERIIQRGRYAFVDAQRTIDLLFEWGGSRILSVANPQSLLAVGEAVIGGNDDILIHYYSTMIGLPVPVLNGIIEQSIDLGEFTWLQNVLRLSNLDAVSALQLLRRAIRSPLNTSLQLMEMFLQYYPISEEEYIVDLVEQGSRVTSLLATIIRRKPTILSHRFGTDRMTPLHHATLSGKLRILQLLVQHGVGINSPDINGNTALHIASESASNLACLTWLLTSDGIDINYRNRSGLTPFLYAVQAGNLQAVNLILKNEADVNAATDEGYTALHLAYARYCQAVSDKFDSSKSFLEVKASQKKESELLKQMVKVLLDFGADESAVEYTMGFNPKGYFEWLLENMERERRESVITRG